MARSAATDIYWFSKDTIEGAGSGAMEAVSADALKDKDVCFVIDETTNPGTTSYYIYKYVTGSSETTSIPEIVEPSDYATYPEGKWHLAIRYVEPGSDDPVNTANSQTASTSSTVLLTDDYDTFHVTASATNSDLELNSMASGRTVTVTLLLSNSRVITFSGGSAEQLYWPEITLPTIENGVSQYVFTKIGSIIYCSQAGINFGDPAQ